MKNKIKYLAGSLSGLVGLVALKAHALTDPLGIASSSENVTAMTKDYIGVLVQQYWPLVLGGLVLGAVIGAVIFVFHQFRIGGGR